MALIYWSLAEIYCLQVGNKLRLSAPHCPSVHLPNSRLEKSSWGWGKVVTDRGTAPGMAPYLHCSALAQGCKSSLHSLCCCRWILGWRRLREAEEL